MSFWGSFLALGVVWESIFELWGCILEALGLIFEDLLVPGGLNDCKWPQVAKKGRFFTKR